MRRYSRRQFLHLGMFAPFAIPDLRQTRWRIVVTPNPLIFPSTSPHTAPAAERVFVTRHRAAQEAIKPVPAQITAAAVESWLFVSAPGGIPANSVTVNAGTQIVVYAAPAALAAGTTYTGHIVYSGAGMQSITATVLFPVTAGPAVKVGFTNLPTNGIINTPFSVSIAAQDYLGNTVTTYSGTVTLTKASGPGTLRGTTTATISSGVATLNTLIVDTSGAYTLTAAAPGLTSATSSAFTINNYPTYFTEPFTFSGNLDGHTSGGYAWAETTAGVLVANGTQLTSSGYTSGTKFGLVTLPSANGSLTCKMTGDFISTVFRYTDASNYWFVRFVSGNGVYLMKRVAGVETILYRYQGHTTAGASYGARFNGSSVFLTDGGVPVFGIEDSFNQTATQIGVRADLTGYIWDDFECDANAPYIVNSAVALPDSDNFTRIDGPMGATSGSGRAWFGTPGMHIASNKAAATASEVDWQWVQTPNADGTTTVGGNGNTPMGVMTRSNPDTAHYIRAWDNGATIVDTNAANGRITVHEYQYLSNLAITTNQERFGIFRDGVLVAIWTQTASEYTANGTQVHRGMFAGGSADTGTSFAIDAITSAIARISGARSSTPSLTLDGNSIMSGAGIYYDPNRTNVTGDDQYRPDGALCAAFAATMDVVTQSISGTTIAVRDAGASGSGWDSFHDSSRPAEYVILYEGTNSEIVGGATATSVWNDFVTYSTNRKTSKANRRVYIVTWLARSDSTSGQDAIRLQVIRWMRGLDSGTRPSSPTWDGIIDMCAPTGAGGVTGSAFYPTDDRSGTSSTTYWQGGLHPTKFGHDYFNPVLVNAVKNAAAFGVSSVQFSATAGGSSPSNQSLSLTATGAWSIATATLSGGSWLSVSPISGAGSATLTVSVTTGALTAGLYYGTITLTNGVTTLVLPVLFAVN